MLPSTRKHCIKHSNTYYQVPENMSPCSLQHVSREQTTCNQTPENMFPSTPNNLSKHMNKTVTKNQKTFLQSARTHSKLMLPARRKHVTHQPFFACWAHVETHSLHLSKEYVIVFQFCVGLLSCVHAFWLSDMHSLSVLIKCQTGLRVAPGKHSNKCYQAHEKTASNTRHILPIPENLSPCSP